MKVAVDSYWLSKPTRGMARFARMLSESLGSRAVYLAPQRVEQQDGPLWIRGGSSFFPLWEQYSFPRMARDAGSDVVLCPYNTGPLALDPKIRMVLVLHDLIFMDRTIHASVSASQNLGKHYRRFVVPRVAKAAERIITVSEYSRSTICGSFDIPESRVAVIPPGISERWFDAPRLGNASGPYIFTVAGEAPSKNLKKLIHAFSLMDNEFSSLILKIAGVKVASHSFFQEFAASHKVGGRVEFLSFVDDTALVDLYRGAAAFVCASIAEGFGIPLLEAMATMTPAAASNTTSLPEVGGDAAWYFDPYDPAAIASALGEMLRSPAESLRRTRIGTERARSFSEPIFASRASELWNALERG